MRYKILLFFVAAIGAFPVHSGASELCPYVFRVGLVFSEPLYFVSGQRKLSGTSLDIIKELRKRTSCDFTVEEFSRPSLIERFRTQQVDMSIISIKTTTMDNVGDFVHLFNSPRRLVMKTTSAQKLKDALKNPKVIFGNIIGTQNYYTSEEINFLRKEKRLIEFPDYEAVFSSLKRGKVHAYVASLMMSSYYLKKFNLTDFSLVEDKTNLIPIGYYVSKRRLKKPELQVLHKALLQMQQDGTFVKIYADYTSADVGKQSIIPLQQ